MSKSQDMVREFHERFIGAQPVQPVQWWEIDWKAHAMRACWIMDECLEILEACEKQDYPELVDGYGDVEYFARGGQVSLGIDGEQVIGAIHAANMQKVKLPGVTKIAKPDGWQAPDIAGLIDAQRKP